LGVGTSHGHFGPQDTSQLGLGGSHHLPPYSILCTTFRDEIITEGRTQYLTLHLPDSTELSIINTYAPRTSRDRATLWKKIGEANITAKHVIIGGDFNHMEKEEARGKVGERRMHRREAASWHHLTLQYELLNAWTLDSFKKMSKKEYTFDTGGKARGQLSHRNWMPGEEE